MRRLPFGGVLLRRALQAGHQVVEFLALHGDMGAQRLARPGGIAFHKRIDDRLVLGHGLRHTPAKPQLLTPERLEPFMQLGGFLFEEPIAGLLIDDSMESLVFGVIGIAILHLHRRLAVGVRTAQFVQGRIRNPHGGQPPANGFELGHDLEHLHQFDRAGLAHKSAATGDQLDQAGQGKALKSLAKRRAGHAKLLGQAHLVQPVAIPIHAGENQFFQLFGNAIGATVFHGIFLPASPTRCKICYLVYKNIDLQNNPLLLSPGHPVLPGSIFGRRKMKTFVKTAVAAAALAATGTLASATELRLSHQWSNQDVRHKVAQIVADEVAAADVDLDIKIFGSKSLFKPREQYTPLSRGQLDMAVLPLSYAGGQQPAYNLTLMPGLVKNHDHAARLSESPFMEALEAKMAEDDVMVLVHGYLAGGFAGKDKCLTKPEDVEGLQMRAAGKAFEQMLAGAGASIASMASSEIYNAMQTGVLDAANTSSSSFVSYRIYEQVACYTPAGDIALWFMYQPLLMNKTTFEGLTEAQQNALLEASKKAETFYLEEAKKQDAASVEVFSDAGVEIAKMSPEDFEAWRTLAKETSYKAFVEEVSDGQALLDMALAVE